MKNRRSTPGPRYSALLNHLQQKTDPSWTSAWPVVSLSRLVIDKWKRNRTGWQRGELLLRWNWGWFLSEICLAIVIMAFTVNDGSIEALGVLWIPISVLAFWRVNEIVYAFWNDVADSILKVSTNSGLNHVHRLSMLSRSAAGLVVWFAVLYSALGTGSAFKCPFSDFRDALYFSAVTLFSIGQEGQEVQGHIVRILHVYQGVSGFVLLAVAVAVYVGRPTRDA